MERGGRVPRSRSKVYQYPAQCVLLVLLPSKGKHLLFTRGSLSLWVTRHQVTFLLSCITHLAGVPGMPNELDPVITLTLLSPRNDSVWKNATFLWRIVLWSCVTKLCFDRTAEKNPACSVLFSLQVNASQVQLAERDLFRSPPQPWDLDYIGWKITNQSLIFSLFHLNWGDRTRQEHHYNIINIRAIEKYWI